MHHHSVTLLRRKNVCSAFIQCGQEEYVWNVGGPLEHLLVLLCPIVIIEGHTQRPLPKKNMIIKYSDSLPPSPCMEILVTPPIIGDL